MHKHIKENGHWYLLVLLFIAIFSYSKLNDWIEGYEPPNGIVVNMQGEILKESDKQKELRQGIKFWRNQLEAVHKALQEPGEVIALSHRLNEIKNETDAIKKSTEVAVEKMLSERGLNSEYLKNSRAARKEVELKEDQLNGIETSHLLQVRYEAAVKRQPDLVNLEKIISLKIDNFQN